MTHSRAYSRALKRLRQPNARLVVTFSKARKSGRAFSILPQGYRIADGTAQALLARRDLRPCDAGLFPDHPQSWSLRG
jgi:hypothetical protein